MSRKTPFPPPIGSYPNAVETQTEIFVIHKPSKSALLFSPATKILTGFVYKHVDRHLLQTELARQDFIKATGIIPAERSFHPFLATQIFITINGSAKSVWTYPIFVTDFTINEGTPANSKWYSFNTLPFYQIESEVLRTLLRRTIASL